MDFAEIVVRTAGGWVEAETEGGSGACSITEEASPYRPYYLWFVVLAALDAALTGLILTLGGTEANAIARAVIESWGIAGAAAFKAACVVLVIWACETIRRRNVRTALRLAECSVAISTVPVIVGLFCLGDLIILPLA